MRFCGSFARNHYWGEDRRQTPEWLQRWARRCLDAGATAYIVHGVPLLHGIEIYRSRPIFYSLGCYIFHTRTKVGYYDAASWQSVLADCRFEAGRLTALTLHPLVLNEEGVPGEYFFQTRGAPRRADGPTANVILQRLSDLSRQYGTEIQIRNSIGVVGIRR